MAEKSESSPSTQAKWYDQISLNPSSSLIMMSNERTKFRICNRSVCRLSYKVKTTRYYSVMPNRTFGLIEPNDSTSVKIVFKPTSNEKPFGKGDRVTVLVKVIFDPKADPKEAWKERTHRYVLRLLHDPNDKKMFQAK